MQKGYTDVPRENLAGDFLNICDYVHSIKEFIHSCDTPMAIAIQGEWGAGKTSMMNMIKEELGKDNNVLITWFNTWQYSQFEMSKHLSLSLLNNFLETINDRSLWIWFRDNRILNWIGRIIVNGISYVTERFIGQVAAYDVRNMAGNITDNLKALDSLKKIKDKIKKAVVTKLNKEKKEKYIIFIDDLDRLDPRVAVELLEVIKIFLDIERCVFVLALDYDVVVRGLKNKFGSDFDENKAYSFFEKIVQLPFGMPVGLYDIKQYLTKFTGSENNDDSRTENYVKLIKCSVGYNPRRIKRLFNMFILLLEVSNKNRDKEGKDSLNDDEQLLLFAIICMQLEFKEVYEYLLMNHEIINKVIFDTLKREDQLKMKIAEIWGNKYNNEDENLIKKTAKFMQTFWKTLDSDNDDNLSEDEINVFKDILFFSSITSIEKVDTKDKKLQESVAERGPRITYPNWDEFEKVQLRKEDEIKQYIPVAKKFHEMVVSILQEEKKQAETRYGDSTFSFTLPKDLAKSRKKVFASFGMINSVTHKCFIQSLNKEVNDALPKGSKLCKKDDSTVYEYEFASLEEFEEAKQDIKNGVLKSYKILAT